MADWTELPNTAVGVGGIPSGTTVTALRDNPIAIAERAAGAPKVRTDYEIITRTVISGTPAVIDFTAFDSAIYDHYVFKVANVVPQTDGDSLALQTSTDGGATFDSGASAYTSGFTVVDFGTGSSNVTTNDGTSSIIFTSSIGSAGGEDGVSGDVFCNGPHLAKKTQFIFSLIGRVSAARINQFSGGGVRTSSAEVNAVRFFWAAGISTGGNFESGIISMYGVRNS